MDFPKHLPEDINVELLLKYMPHGSFRMALRGLHKRNAYNDIVEVNRERSNQPLLGIARNSIYHALPEYVFHPIDRFNNLPDDKDRFQEEYEKQEEEKKTAARFFAPIDTLLLLIKADCREAIRRYTDTNSVLIDILADELTEEQKANRFIHATMPFMPCCKTIRGNRTLLTLMLRKIFMDEGIQICLHEKDTVCTDPMPRYADGLDSELGEGFLGNVYDEQITTYDVHYWDEDACDEHFLFFIEEMDIYRHFIADYFMSVEEKLNFDITKDGPPLRLSDDIVFNYLNYNSNI